MAAVTKDMMRQNDKLFDKTKKLVDSGEKVKQACAKTGLSLNAYYGRLRNTKVQVVTYDAGANQPQTAAVKPAASGKLALFIGSPDQVLAIFRKL